MNFLLLTRITFYKYLPFILLPEVRKPHDKLLEVDLTVTIVVKNVNHPPGSKRVCGKKSDTGWNFRLFP